MQRVEQQVTNTCPAAEQEENIHKNLVQQKENSDYWSPLALRVTDH